MLRLGKRLMRAGAAGIGFGFIIITGFAVWATTAAQAGNGSFKDDDFIVVDAPMQAWHGCYLGLSAGGNIDSSSATIGAPVTSVTGLPGEGIALGAYTGCSLQAGNLVLGIEGDINTSSGNPKWFASARLRLGFTPTRTMMFYATGGYAFASQTYGVFAGAASTAVNDTASGLAYGGGIEQAIGRGNSLRIEAIHYDYDASRTQFAGGFAEVDQSHTVIRVGVTLSFTGGLFGGFAGGTDPDVIQ